MRNLRKTMNKRQRFCQNCGSSLQFSGSEVTWQALSPVAERLRLTVSVFTRFSPGNSPPTLSEGRCPQSTFCQRPIILVTFPLAYSTLKSRITLFDLRHLSPGKNVTPVIFTLNDKNVLVWKCRTFNLDNGEVICYYQHFNFLNVFICRWFVSLLSLR